MYGEPLEWHFDYPWEKVKLGFWMWSMNGFKRMPHHWEIDEYDPRWISDLQLASTLYGLQKNSSQVMQTAERMFKAGKRLLGIKE